MDNSIIFLSKTFLFWPFARRNGFGFFEKAKITISGGDILVEWKKDSIKYNIKDLEYVFRKNRFFDLRNPAIYLGNSEKSSTFYIHHVDYNNLLIALGKSEPLCFSSETKVLEGESKDTLWINSKHIFSSKKVKELTSDKRSHSTATKTQYVAIEDIKYFYTSGLIYNNLYIGCDTHYVELDNASNDTIKSAQTLLSVFIGSIVDEVADVYKDTFTLNVIFCPSLWFTRSSIGFNDKGIVYKQKTFKTNDNILLPFDKINNLNYESKWYWFTTQKINIYGEQNIIPSRRYSKKDIAKIAKKLEKEGVKTLSGEEYTPSYHTSWFGMISSIITLSIYHWIVVLFSKKRDVFVISENKIAWNGKIYAFNPESNISRNEIKNLTSVFGEVDDIRSIIYVKEHWYHLWGTLYVWFHPSNIRTLTGEASQHSIDYDLELGKIWGCNAKRAISNLKSNGYTANSERDKFYKKWVKGYLKKK